jgi:hypothetical protein
VSQINLVSRQIDGEDQGFAEDEAHRSGAFQSSFA